MNLLVMLQNLIKRAVVTIASKDDNPSYQTAQISYLNRPADIEMLSIYGLSSNAPKDSLVVMFNIQGQEENRAGMANLPSKRFKNLKEGEVAVGNYLTGSFVKFLANGNIEVNAAGKTIDVIGSTVNIKASTLNVTADTHFTGSVKANGKVIDDTHGHTQAPDANGDAEAPINGVI